MSIYGNISSLDIYYEDKFLNFLSESDNYIKSFNFISISESNIITSLVSKIKDMIEKFIKFIKDSWTKLQKRVNDIYMENNFTDKFFQKYKDLVTWENVQKAIQGGWTGLSKDTRQIKRFVSIKDSKFNQLIEQSDSKDKDALSLFGSYTDKIFQSTNLEEAESYYEKCKEEIRKITDEKSQENKKNLKNRLEQELYETPKLIIINKKQFQVPVEKCFLNTKKFTEEGQSERKKISVQYKDALKLLKIEKLKRRKAFKNTKKSTNNEEAQIELLGAKANYQFIVAYIKRLSAINSSILSLLRDQYYHSIRNYLEYKKGIEKYANVENQNKTDNSRKNKNKFTSFDENAFWKAIEEKDYLSLKVNTVSSMLDDPTFARGETKRVLKILNDKVPEIFETEIKLDYEERLERSAWDKRYFTKLTYWFQENFAKSRIPYIKEVGRAVHQDTRNSFVNSMYNTYSEDDFKRNGLTDTFINAVKKNKVLKVRIMIKNSLLMDLSFEESTAMLYYARNMKGLYDKYNGEKFELDETKWDKDYMNEQLYKLVDNFCPERIDHLKDVIYKLYPDG